jgi:hypothetical protein
MAHSPRPEGEGLLISRYNHDAVFVEGRTITHADNFVSVVMRYKEIAGGSMVKIFCFGCGAPKHRSACRVRMERNPGLRVRPRDEAWLAALILSYG